MKVTVYNILEMIDKNPILKERVSVVRVYFYDCDKSKESIEFRKNFELNSWAYSVRKAVEDNEFLQSLFSKGSVLDSNLGAIRLSISTQLEIVVTASFIAEELQAKEEDKEKYTIMDNQQLSKDIKDQNTNSLNNCKNTMTAKDVIDFCSAISDDTKIFVTDGKKISPVTMVSSIKSGTGEIITVFGNLSHDLVFESSTTRDNPVDVK